LMPRALSAVHSRFRTPYVAILVSSVVMIALALSGSFATLAAISTIIRLLTYAATCAALLRLRRQPDAPPAAFTAPFGGLAATLALVLAGIGIYGVIAFAVSQRTYELGLRMALGADEGATLRLVMGRSVALIAVGTVCGLVASVVAARVIAGLLYAVAPLDPVVFISVSALLALAGVVATLIPARRAMRLDPTIAIRGE